MFDHLFWIVVGAVIVALCYLIYIGATKGLPAAWAKLKSWWTATETDLASLASRVTALENRLGMNAPATKAPAPAPAPAVQQSPNSNG